MAKLVIGTDKTVGTPAIVTVTTDGKYAIMARVKDDNNDDIGCVVGYHTDSNNQKYAVVCLNKEYRTTSNYMWLSDNVAVSNLPNYTDASMYEAPETATFNCDKILAQATASSLTSTAVSQCRTLSFTIDGNTYYGQLPSIPEILYIMMHRTEINTNDPSVSGAEIVTTASYWSSTQYDTTRALDINAGVNLSGTIALNSKYSSYRVIPILEIPID